MVARFLCALLLVVFSAVALGSSVAPEHKGVPAPFPGGFVVRAESGILVDLTGSWLGGSYSFEPHDLLLRMLIPEPFIYPVHTLFLNFRTVDYDASDDTNFIQVR
jgi:hypothetical protein